MSRRKRRERREIRDWRTLQSPFFSTARRRSFRVGHARYRLLLLKEEFELFCSFTITGAGWVNDVNNFSFSSLSGEDDFEIGSFATFPFISASSFSSLPFLFLFLFSNHDSLDFFFAGERKYVSSPRDFNDDSPLYILHIFFLENTRKIFLVKYF